MGRGPRPGWGLGASRRRGPGRSQGRALSPPCFPTSHCSQRDHPLPHHSPHPRPPAVSAGPQVPQQAQLRRPSCPRNHGTDGNPAPGPAPRGLPGLSGAGAEPWPSGGGPLLPRSGLRLYLTHSRGRHSPACGPQSRGLPTPLSQGPRVLDRETEASRAEVTDQSQR